MRVERATIGAYTIPTATPESDGTLEWNATTIVVVELAAAGLRSVGYTYDHAAAAQLASQVLAPHVVDHEALDVPAAWMRMMRSVRNIGRPGIASCAISAFDVALWDLKARLLDVPLLQLLGAQRERIAAYGSGGFTSYTVAELQAQLGGWAAQGFRRVKMKVGRAPDEDDARVRAGRQAIGDAIELFVDANGAYDRKKALAKAEVFADSRVTWFEEPVTSDDLEGMRLIRDRAPSIMNITSGEYGYDSTYFRHMLDAQAVDILQADATRCCGITGFMQAAALCQARHVPFSSHTAPLLHAPLACAAPTGCHAEYFFDHVRIESMLFDGGPRLENGALVPSPDPGLGAQFKSADAERYRVFGPATVAP